MMLNDDAFTPNLAERMDKLISSGQVRPMIVVMPDCFTRYGGSQYLKSSATGNYEDYVSSELVDFVDANFRTVPDRQHRAVMGKSSGGYGALVMGMRHADTFGLVASISGDMYFEYCYQADICKAFRAVGGDRAAFLDRFFSTERKRKDDFAALNMIAMSSCYSPNGTDFDLIFDLETGAIRGETAEKWFANDPVRMVEKHAADLASLDLLFLDAGTRDEFFLDIGARILSKKLRELGIDHIHEEFDDGHFNVSYRYDRALELISETIPN
jgi:enterochelin esterase family protein